jgi:hypothetical protein
VTILAAACATLDVEIEQIALRYAEGVGGILPQAASVSS